MIIWLDTTPPPVRSRKINDCSYLYDRIVSIEEAEFTIMVIDNLSYYEEYCGDRVEGVDIGDGVDVIEFLRWLKEDGRKYDMPRLRYHGEDPFIKQQVKETIRECYIKELKFDD